MGRGLRPKGGVRQYKKTLFFVNLVLFIIPVTYYGYQPFLRACASIVIIDEQPKKSDAILVLAGGDPGRAWAAADLYRSRLADYVVLTKERPLVDEERLRQHGIELVDGRGNYARVLRGFGVPEERIVDVEKETDDTFSELQEVRGLLERRKWKSLIIVTSNYHTRRTRMSARLIFGSDFEFAVVASRYGGLNPDSWWKNRGDVRTFLIEFQKLVAYTLYIWPRLVWS